MVTYRMCFKHNRLYHPQRMHWEFGIHDLPPHPRFHLEAAQCDRCLAERPDTRTENSEHVAAPLPSHQ
jgi:hypothetical protein